MPTQTQTHSAPVAFFLANAGYSYNPATETEAEGKLRGAKALAEAEAFARDNGYRFLWEYDQITNRDFTDEGPEYSLWVCDIVRNFEDGSQLSVGSLGGIDLGEFGRPCGSYPRVVEAELASEHALEHCVRA